MSTTTGQFQDLLTDFVNEAVGSLQDLPEKLAASRGGDGGDAVNAVFRAVHSIKGSAGFLELSAVKQFAHSLENSLDEVRTGKATLTDELQRALLQAFDQLEELLNEALEGNTPLTLDPRRTELLDRIKQLLQPAGDPDDVAAQALLRTTLALAEEMAAANLAPAAEWSSRLRAACAHFDSATFDEEAAMEQEEGSAATAVKIPDPETFQGVPCRLNDEDVTERMARLLEVFWKIRGGMRSAEFTAEFARSAEEFAGWAEGVGQIETARAVRAAAANFGAISSSKMGMDPFLLSVIWDGLYPALAHFWPTATAPAAAKGSAKEAGANGATHGGGDSAGDAGSKARMIRVREERLDEFLDQVSTLFITGELLKDVHYRMTQSESRQVDTLVEELRQLSQNLAAQTKKLQQGVVGLRRVPVRNLFSKFPRMARTLAEQLGKQIDVHTGGEEIEIDKSLLEDLDGPLTHMIRNVLDHAIETPDERRKRGVAEAGNLWLNCETTRTHLRFVIRDDGRGIDPARLRKKAVEKSVLSADQAGALDDDGAIDLIFHPGFSTAEKISEVSGRGVGMDVVRTKVREHNGDVNVSSKVGVGTTFVLEIPIRQAVLVIDGLLVEQSAQQFVVPFEHIQEITEIDADGLHTVQGTAQVAVVRGTTYGAVSLASVLGIDVPAAAIGGKVPAVIVGGKQGAACVLVDRVLGHRQVVVHHIPTVRVTNNISGVAQLGAGRMALVVSAADVVRNMSGKA